MWRLVFSIAILLSSCSSSKEKHSMEKQLNQLTNIPLENLLIIRILPGFASDQFDKDLLWQTLVQECKKIGEVHTPADTSLEKLVEEQKKPFAILTLNINEVETVNSDDRFPLINIQFRVHEKTQLNINQKEWMSVVWEKTKYVKTASEKETNTESISQVVKHLIDTFSADYYSVNQTTTKPTFYISNPIQ